MAENAHITNGAEGSVLTISDGVAHSACVRRHHTQPARHRFKGGLSRPPEKGRKYEYPVRVIHAAQLTLTQPVTKHNACGNPRIQALPDVAVMTCRGDPSGGHIPKFPQHSVKDL